MCVYLGEPFNGGVLCAHLSMRSNSCKPEPLRANISETVGRASEQDKITILDQKSFRDILRSNSHI